MALPDYPEAYPFVTNQAAATEFAAGVRIIKEVPYDAAAARFVCGLGHLGFSAGRINDIEAGYLDVSDLSAGMRTLQASDGFRDLGVTDVRIALALGDEPELGRQHIERSARALRAAHDIAQTVLDEVVEDWAVTTESVFARRYSAAIGRVGVAAAVILRLADAERRSEYGSTPAYTAENFEWMADGYRQASIHELFDRVDGMLAQGDNGYWRISNALVALRSLRADGASLFSPEARGWYRTVREAWQWTREHDSGNVRASAKTIARHGLSLRTQAAAARAATSPQHV